MNIITLVDSRTPMSYAIFDLRGSSFEIEFGIIECDRTASVHVHSARADLPELKRI
jgi:hypothetical protein